MLLRSRTPLRTSAKRVSRQEGTVVAVWSKKPISLKTRDIGRLPSFGAIPTLQGDFPCDVTRCYPNSGITGSYALSSLHFIQIGFFDHTGLRRDRGGRQRYDPVSRSAAL